ncbi:alpha/beta hydrolase [Nonomuraea insulae]|uniref:Alpha/beta hydrolase n=1 Tax=Nonomuraea insulae TaxID=1616787 RepID=A0ABW1CT69_9ACTN
MPLDPQLRAMLERAATVPAIPLSQLPPAVVRYGFLASILAWLGEDYEPLPLAEVREHTIDGAVPVRIYRPDATTPSLPVVAFAHAGGWVLGDLETHDEVCRHLSHALPAVVVAVDYRRAPEHPYPAAIDDYWAAVCWLAGHAAELGGDAGRLAVIGDSAGGNLAAAAALRAREAGGPRIAVQALAYPTVDATLDCGAQEGGSYLTCGEGYGLTLSMMRWFVDSYLPDPADRTASDASPLFADLSGLPPAIVATAEYDPLRTEGERYAHRLARAGVAVTHLELDGLVHGFLYQTRISHAADRAREAFIGAVREALGSRLGDLTEARA